MSIWVRSQDKEFLMKVDNINLGIDVDTKKPNRLFTFVDGVTTSFTLGKYKSKERALEVLDEIQKKINDIKKDFLMACMREKGVYDVIAWNDFVYQMPKE